MFSKKHKDTEHFNIEIKTDFWSKKQTLLIDENVMTDTQYDLIEEPVLSPSKKHFYCIGHISINGEDYSRIIYDTIEGNLFGGISDAKFEIIEGVEIMSYKGISLLNKFKLGSRLVINHIRITSNFDSMKDATKIFQFQKKE